MAGPCCVFDCCCCEPEFNVSKESTFRQMSSPSVRNSSSNQDKDCPQIRVKIEKIILHCKKKFVLEIVQSYFSERNTYR